MEARFGLINAVLALLLTLSLIEMAWLAKISRKLNQINRKADKIMATETELAAQLNDIATQLTKVDAEVQTLLQRIKDLEDQIANAQVSPELQAAFDAVKAQAQKVDDNVPDAPNP